MLAPPNIRTWLRHCVEGKLAGGEFGMMNANKESFFSLIIPSISV